MRLVLAAFSSWLGLAALASHAAERTAPPLQWEQRPGFRVASLRVPHTGKTGFTLLAPEQTKIFFTNQLSFQRSAAYLGMLEGAGVCAGDFDGDGWPDLYFCNSSGANALFRNRGGFAFEEVTVAAGVTCSHQLSRGAVFADVNGDGWLDLVVTSITGPNACLLNDGHGHFQDFTREAGLELRDMGSTSLALADLDGDGWLDLYVANTGAINMLQRSITISIVNGQPTIAGRARQHYRIVEGRLLSKGYAPALYRNQGQGRFQRLSWTDGSCLDAQGKALSEPPGDLALSVMFRDLNGDGAPDIYVCNDWHVPDRIWINDGHGHFRALQDLALRKTSLFSMSVDFADINRDGYDDSFNADMISHWHPARLRQAGGTNPPAAHVGEVMDRQQTRRNTLQLNRGDGTFAEIGQFAGVQATDWTWCCAFLDVDLDGYEDLLTLTGHIADLQDRDAMEKVSSAAPEAVESRGGPGFTNFPPLAIPNFLFHNLGNCRFDEVGAKWGFNSSNACYGLSLTDLDNDGDQDVVLTCLGKPPLIYRNDSDAPRVAVRLKGAPPNTFGIGARISLHGGAVPTQTQEMICGGRYLSSDQPMRTFAAGTATNEMSLEVVWRSGKRSLVEGAQANRVYEIGEAAALPASSLPAQAPPSPWFEDVSSSLNHQHRDPLFDDFERQKLLPRRLSQLGPGVAWLDLNGDGREDLVIGGGKGSGLGVFLNQGTNRWERLSGPWDQPLPDDSAAIVGGTLVEGQRSLFAGLAHYESSLTNAPSVLRFDWPALLDSAATRSNSPPAPVLNALSIVSGSTGPILLADVDADGTLDLFIGGRLQAGHYPEAVNSHLLRNKRGQLLPDAGTDALLARLGLVTAAAFSDLDGDGYPELLVACEWGGVRAFHNERGRLQPWAVPLIESANTKCLPPGISHLNDLSGLWTSVTTADFDSDGKLDIVLGNWGLNSGYQLTSPGPWYLYYGDFNGDDQVHLLESYRDPDSGQVVPARDLTTIETDLPWIRTGFPTHLAYSQATLPGILAERAAAVRSLKLECLASLLLLNRGDKFEVKMLPPPAQWSPVMGLTAGDFDGDGNEDLFLSQNYFAVRPEDERLDAGRGLLLRGHGDGIFSPVSGQLSGLCIYGQQRGCASADYDADGRLDLVVCQNDGPTKLFHNRQAKPGLRVKLNGPKGNPDGIGAVVRLQFGSRFGPALEVQAGGGFWSQNSSTRIFGTPEPPTAIQVGWPGGRTTTGPVPEDAHQIQLSADGRLQVLK